MAGEGGQGHGRGRGYLNLGRLGEVAERVTVWNIDIAPKYVSAETVKKRAAG